MRLNLLVSAVAVLVTLLPRCGCRAIDPQDEKAHEQLPLLTRLGEEYLIRLDNAAAARGTTRTRIRPAVPPVPSSGETTINRALQLQLTQRLERAGGLDSSERARRAEEPPISLDLTFHLLREVLEMARAEQLAQQADSNRRMMDIYGR